MPNDEVTAIRTLKEYWNIMSKHIEQHSGRIVDVPGDNLLAEFGSAVDAVQCVVDIQKKFKVENDDLPKDRRLQSRMSVNLADVVQDGDNI